MLLKAWPAKDSAFPPGTGGHVFLPSAIWNLHSASLTTGKESWSSQPSQSFCGLTVGYCPVLTTNDGRWGYNDRKVTGSGIPKQQLRRHFQNQLAFRHKHVSGREKVNLHVGQQFLGVWIQQNPWLEVLCPNDRQPQIHMQRYATLASRTTCFHLEKALLLCWRNLWGSQLLYSCTGACATPLTCKKKKVYCPARISNPTSVEVINVNLSTHPHEHCAAWILP